MRSLGFEYICALSQNRSNKIYSFSFENIQNRSLNPAISWFKNGIQMTMPLVFCAKHYYLLPLELLTNKLNWFRSQNPRQNLNILQLKFLTVSIYYICSITLQLFKNCSLGAKNLVSITLVYTYSLRMSIYIQRNLLIKFQTLFSSL